MTVSEYKALKNAAASSAMEGLPLNERDMVILTDIVNGKISLQDYFQSLKQQEQQRE